MRNQNEVEHTNPPLVASLADCEVEDESLSGGKGRSLYIMTHSNNEGMLDIEDSLKPVSIPNGIVVTSEAFKRQIKFIDTMKGDKFMSNLISDLEAKSSDYSVSHAHWCTTVEINMYDTSSTNTRNPENFALFFGNTNKIDPIIIKNVRNLI